jgi:hypothetical protein
VNEGAFSTAALQAVFDHGGKGRRQGFILTRVHLLAGGSGIVPCAVKIIICPARIPVSLSMRRRSAKLSGIELVSVDIGAALVLPLSITVART